jgi:hypothetical protein
MNGANPAAKPPEVPPMGLMRLETARLILGAVWLIPGMGIFVLVAAQSLLNVYQTRVGDVWDWFLPTVVPTLSLVISVLAYSALSPDFSGAMVRKSFFYAAAFLSVVYLLLIAVTILSLPVSAATLDEKIASLHGSNKWLGPLQGVVAAALGVFFTSKQSKTQKKENGSSG